jgi:hypothetical protein
MLAESTIQICNIKVTTAHYTAAYSRIERIRCPQQRMARRTTIAMNNTTCNSRLAPTPCRLIYFVPDAQVV